MCIRCNTMTIKLSHDFPRYLSSSHLEFLVVHYSSDVMHSAVKLEEFFLFSHTEKMHTQAKTPIINVQFLLPMTFIVIFIIKGLHGKRIAVLQ